MQVNWTPEAQSDLDGIVEFIAADNPFAASNLAETLFETAEKLGQMPYIGRTGRVVGLLPIPTTFWFTKWLWTNCGFCVYCTAADNIRKDPKHRQRPSETFQTAFVHFKTSKRKRKPHERHRHPA